MRPTTARAVVARAVWLLAAAAAMHPMPRSDGAAAALAAGAGASPLPRVRLRLRGGSSRGLAAAQAVELAVAPQEAAAALASCAPSDMASFESPAAVNKALAAMPAVPPPARASLLPALLRSALGRAGAWKKGSSIARTLRLLSELHLSALAPPPGADAGGARGGATPPTPCAALTESVRALAAALVSHGVLNAGILATFSAASVADALASLAALGPGPTVPDDVLSLLYAQAAQAGVASVREGCDLLWAGSVLRLQSAALLLQVEETLSHGLAPALGMPEIADLFWASVEGNWLPGGLPHGGNGANSSSAQGAHAHGASIEDAARALLLQVCRQALPVLKAGSDEQDPQALVPLLLSALSLLERSSAASAHHQSPGAPAANASAGGERRQGEETLREGLCRVVAALCDSLRGRRFAPGEFGRHPARDPTCGEWLHRAREVLPKLRALSQARYVLLRSPPAEGGEDGTALGLALEASARAAACLFRRLVPASLDFYAAPTAGVELDAACHVTQELLAWANVRIGYYLWQSFCFVCVCVWLRVDTGQARVRACAC